MRVGAERVAVVVGGTGSVGTAVSSRLGQDGVTCASFEADILDRHEVVGAAKDIRARWGQVSDLVVVADSFTSGPLESTTRAAWDGVVDHVLTGTFNVIQAFVPAMADAGHGAVVVVAGQEARRGVAHHAAVSAAGWGLLGLTKTVALEVAPSGVQVIALCAGPLAGRNRTAAPGLTVGPLQRRSFVEDTEVADAVAFLLSPTANTWTGSVVDVSLGMAARNSS